MSYTVSDHIIQVLEAEGWFLFEASGDGDGWNTDDDEDALTPAKALAEDPESCTFDPDAKAKEIIAEHERHKARRGNYGYYWVAPDGWFHYSDAIAYLRMRGELDDALASLGASPPVS